jgi:hypothetical protein
MLNDTLIFIGLLVTTLIAYMSWTLRGESWRKYFSTKDGKGILRGIVVAPLAILVLGVAFSLIPTCAKADWLNDATVFAGLDYTKSQSPQCEVNQIDNHGTSNLGVKLNVWQSASENVRVNSKYTHHSCALGKDARLYDALGVELEWRVWSR